MNQLFTLNGHTLNGLRSFLFTIGIKLRFTAEYQVTLS